MIFGCYLSNNRVIERPDKSGAELRSLEPVFFSLTVLTLPNLFWKFKLHHLDLDATVCAFALNSSYLGLYDLKNDFCQDLINRDLTSYPSLHKIKFFPLFFVILSFLTNLLFFYFSQFIILSSNPGAIIGTRKSASIYFIPLVMSIMIQIFSFYKTWQLIFWLCQEQFNVLPYTHKCV